jgi:hypothetical protein
MPSAFRLFQNAIAAVDELRIQVGEAGSTIPGSKDHDDATARRKHAGMMTKQLAREPLTAITHHGITHAPTGNDAKRRQLSATCPAQFTLKYKRPAVDTMFRSADLLKITLLT